MKKRLLLTVTLLLGIMIGSFAQEMQVTSFRKLDNDLAAKRQGTSRKDNNGRDAALIRIVTPGRGYAFDGGSIGIVGNVEYHSGEIWVYVPERAQKISITHEQYGVLRDYYYSEPIVGGTTYEMLLDPGVGRYCNITASQAGSAVFVDGDSIGVSPVANHYMTYGQHYVKAQTGRLIGERNVNITKDADTNIRLEMEDMSRNYVQVSIRVDDEAEIWYNDEKKGVGVWNTELYKGEYVIQARKENAESRFTTIKVEPGHTDPIVITAPVPYQGYLRITTVPRDAVITAGQRKITNGSQMQLNAGPLFVNVTRRGYYSVEKEYVIPRNTQVNDTIKMEHISYVKENQLYFGAGANIGPLSGITALAGGTIKNFDIQFSYTLGMSSTDVLYWYVGDKYASAVQYKQNTIGVKLGYQFEPITRLALVPQLGYSLLSLSASTTEGTDKAGDGAKCSCVTVSARAEFAPGEHFGLFIAPEYAIAMKKDKKFEDIADKLGMTSGGLSITAGLYVKF